MATRAQIDAAIEAAAQKHGVDPQYLKALAEVESSYNPSAKNKLGSGASGLFQFMPLTAQSYGLDDPTDYKAAAEAAARFTVDNQRYLTKFLGRAPTPQELYIAHQQGAGGARKILLSNPNSNAINTLGFDKVAQNVPRLKGESNAAFRARIQSMTVGQFNNTWNNKFGNAYGNVAVGTELSTQPTQPPVPMPRDARPQVPVPMPRDARPQAQQPAAPIAGLNLPRPKPPALSGNPIFDINRTPRLNADGVAVYGNFPRDLSATDYGAARASLFAPSAPVGTTGFGTPRQMAPLTVATMPSSYYTGIPTLAAPVQNMVRPGVPSGLPAARPVAPVRQTSMMTPAAPTYQRPTGFNPYNPNGVNDVTNSYGRFVPGQPSGAIRNVTTQTVRQNGTVVTSPRAGTTALPANVRPNLAPIVTTPRPTSYGAGLSFPSGVGVPPKPTTTPLTGFGGMTGTYKPPTVNPLTGFGGMTGTYTPPKTAPIPQTRPTTTSAGVKTSSSSGSSSQSTAPATFKGSSTGQTYTVGQKYTAGGYTYVAQPNGTFKKV